MKRYTDKQGRSFTRESLIAKSIYEGQYCFRVVIRGDIRALEAKVLHTEHHPDGTTTVWYQPMDSDAFCAYAEALSLHNAWRDEAGDWQPEKHH